MPQENAYAKRYARELAILSQLFHVLGRRTFDRQIRSEECGCCTEVIAAEILRGTLLAGDLPFRELREVLYQNFSFYYMPRFTREVLRCGIDATKKEHCDLKRDGKPGPPSFHDTLADAITELAHTGLKHYQHARYLLFSRIAEPLRMIREEYLRLCDEVGAPEKRKAPEFDLIESAVKQLVADQSVDGWTECYRQDRDVELRRHKRVWSGGVCNLAVPDGGDVRVKVACFWRTGLAIYSQHMAKPNDIFRGTVSLNAIDLPLQVHLEVDGPATEALRESLSRRSRASMLKGWGLEHTYVMDFKDSTPEPQYYFKSMCRHLLEEVSEWPMAMFAEMFLHDFGVRPSMDDYGC